MQAVQFDSKKKTVQKVELNIPEITQENHVLIKVVYSGICGSDIHIIEGDLPTKPGLVTIGHEFSGIVAKIGKGVTHVKVGDEVAIDPDRCCYKCKYCRIGAPHFCVNFSHLGVHQDGGWAEYCLVNDPQVHKLPSHIHLCQAALIEPLSCLIHSMEMVKPWIVGQEILVLGAGIIGNLLMSMLHLQGHRKVIVSEPNEYRRKQTEKLDLGYPIMTPDKLKETKKPAFDIVMDCCGQVSAMEVAMKLLKHGGKMCIFGVASPKAILCVSPYEMFNRELTFVGSKVNPYAFPKAMHMLESLISRYISYEILGVKEYSLNNYEQAVDSMKKGSVAKPMFKF